MAFLSILFTVRFVVCRQYNISKVGSYINTRPVSKQELLASLELLINTRTVNKLRTSNYHKS